MAKQSNPFGQNTKPEKVDPIAQAQAEYAAQQAAADTAKQADTQEKVPTDVVQEIQAVQEQTSTVTNTAPTELNVTSKTEANVTDTTTPTSRELTESSILKTSTAQKARNVVQRPTGASTREASPQSQTTQTTHVESNTFSSLISAEKKSGTVSAVAVITFFETYVKTMAPKKITSITDIVRMQEGLYDQLMFIIERAPAKEFNRLWNLAIQFVGEYKNGAFAPAYYNRGAREWKRDPKQFTVLSSLVNLLVATANDRNSVNQVVNVDAVVGSGFSEDGRGRIFNFYSK